MLLARLLPLLLIVTSVLSQDQQQDCDPSSNDGTCTISPGDGDGHEHEHDDTPRLPDDFVDPCLDSGSPDCPLWASQGECKANPNYMLANCARSCGSCTPLTRGGGGAASWVDGGGGSAAGRAVLIDAGCRDHQAECPRWAGEGECAINPKFMLSVCKYSCWKCMNAKKDEELGLSEDVIARKQLFMNMDIGKHQLIRDVSNSADNPMTELDREMVRKTLRKMDTYLSNVVAEPDAMPAKSRERCRNEHRMCAEWAGRGRCPRSAVDYQKGEIDRSGGMDDAIFMMNVCPLACQMCGELESFHRCSGRRHPRSVPSFRSGEELYSFFEEKRLSKDELSWAKYEPVFASYPNPNKEGSESDPYVVILKKFLSDEEADHLRSLEAGFSFSDKVYDTVMRRFASLVNANSTDYLEPMEIHHGPSAQNEGGSTNTFQHNYEVSGLWKPSGPRVISMQLFLASGTDISGGELGFPFLDWLHIKPRKGMAVLWTNVRKENILEADPLTSFEHFAGESSIPVSNVHVRMYNWTDANIRGCD